MDHLDSIWSRGLLAVSESAALVVVCLPGNLLDLRIIQPGTLSVWSHARIFPEDALLHCNGWINRINRFGFYPVVNFDPARTVQRFQFKRYALAGYQSKEIFSHESNPPVTVRIGDARRP